MRALNVDRIIPLGPFALWLDRSLSLSKFARGVLRFAACGRVASIVDISSHGLNDGSSESCHLLKGHIVVSTIEAARDRGAKSLLIGVCPIDANNAFPDKIREAASEAISLGLAVINPLHVMPWDDPFFKNAPETWNSFVNLREASSRRLYADEPLNSFRVLTGGHDCSVGKMTTALALTEALKALGIRAAFLATGQTGVIIEGGRGIAIDHIEGDFMAGAVEESLIALESEADVIVIEGQGSILHPAYSGVTAALLHGARPDAMVLCRDPERRHLKFFSNRPTPTLAEEWAAIVAMSRPGEPPSLIGVAEPGGRGIDVELGVPCRDPLVDGVFDFAQTIRVLLETEIREKRVRGPGR